MSRSISNGNGASTSAHAINQNAIDMRSALAGGPIKTFKMPPENLIPSKNNTTETKPHINRRGMDILLKGISLFP
ncbi:hypothetical protein [Sphingobium yanoikuyae]|uniref:hypothetical protein n=1 Tax=Sphingobium yanoikuyae TaxID=13690 RepID=UPI0013DF25B4|nr:hypothetical protein [Sphingobium yanoikuyae]